MKIYKNKITFMVTIIIECILLAACGNNIDEKNNININEDAKEIEIPVVNKIEIGISVDELFDRMEGEYKVIEEKNNKFIHYYPSVQDNNDSLGSDSKKEITGSGIDFFINISTNTVSGFEIMSKGYDFSVDVSIGDKESDAISVLRQKYSEYNLEVVILDENYKLFEINEDYIIGIFINENTSLVQSIYVVKKEYFLS